MSLHNAIRSLLVNDTELGGLVADRIRPFQAAQIDARPFILLDIEEAKRRTYAGGINRSSQSTIDVGVYADSFQIAQEMKVAVQRILQGFIGNQSGERVSYCNQSGESNSKTTTLPGNSTPVYVEVVTFNATHRPAGG